MWDKTSFTKLFITAFFFAWGVVAPGYAQISAQAEPALACPPPTTAAPIWGKLVVSGNTVTCYYAKGLAKPNAWTQLGQTQTIGFVNNPLLVGIYLTSHNANALSAGTIDNFSITPSSAYRLADHDVGAPELMGSANLIGGVWSLSGSGADIWGTSDQFNFQPWLVWGDCTIICRVTSLTTSGDPWEKIGIMVRDGFNSGSDFALFCATNGSGVAFQYRLQFENNSDETLLVAPPAPGVTSGVAIGYGLTGSTSYVLRP